MERENQDLREENESLSKQMRESQEKLDQALKDAKQNKESLEVYISKSNQLSLSYDSLLHENQSLKSNLSLLKDQFD